MECSTQQLKPPGASSLLAPSITTSRSSAHARAHQTSRKRTLICYLQQQQLDSTAQYGGPTQPDRTRDNCRGAWVRTKGTSSKTEEERTTGFLHLTDPSPTLHFRHCSVGCPTKCPMPTVQHCRDAAAVKSAQRVVGQDESLITFSCRRRRLLIRG